MNILMYTHNLDKQNGGVTFALKTRAEALTDEGYDVHIVTHGFSTNLQLEPYGYKHVNIFDYYSNYKGQPITDEVIYYDDEILYPDKNDKKNRTSRVFSRGEYKQYRQYELNGELKFIDVFDLPWTRSKKYLFKNNQLVKILYMNSNNKPKLAKYITKGNCYITSAVNPNTWKDVNIYNHVNSTEETLFDFKLNFLEEYIKKNKINIIFIDKREDVELFLKIKNAIPLVKLVFVLHNNHYNNYEKDEGLHPTLTLLFDNLEKFHKVILLTQEQKEKIVSEFGYKDKFTVLSNIVKYDNLKNIAKTRKNLISIGRYEPVKNMIEIIEVFDLVAEKIPDVRLDLYGYGKEKDKLLALAKGKNIGIHEFVSKPKEIMQNSSLFLLLSLYEGHPLVLLECYDVQCPVFSYPVKFGAKDTIENYENGILLDKRDKTEMSEQIISYIREEFSFKFEKRASELFSKKRYIQQLMAIFDEN